MNFLHIAFHIVLGSGVLLNLRIRLQFGYKFDNFFVQVWSEFYYHCYKVDLLKTQPITHHLDLIE